MSDLNAGHEPNAVPELSGKTVAEQIAEKEKEQLEKLVAYFGSQALLARFCQVADSIVSDWVKRGRISAKKAAFVEEHTKGLFKKADLRPDVKDWFL